MTRPSLNDDFVDVLAALEDARAEFIIVGAHALAAHGIIRATGDIDILVRPTDENARRVRDALLAFGAPLNAHGVVWEDFARAGTVYQLGLPPRRIDILTSISGVTFEEAWASRMVATLAGVSAHVIGREALLRNKRASGRPKDLLDAEVLEKLRDPVESG